jgi:(4-(4-[2-(gamma-L-glutamylamino)ethyl]phenoxymethyl)furan-2-yl)methanamine synthase
MNWLGFDIGGANLKVADGCGWARTVPFALWRNPGGLSDAIAKLIRQAPTAHNLAVTMTGELCDCFRTKAEGVQHILAAVEQAAAGRNICVYLVDGRFVPVLLVDIGSTTTDLVPLVDGRPWTLALTDTERLIRGELVYTGVGRTPLCAVTRTLPWRGQSCPVAAELFATTADAYVLLGDMPEQPDADWTTDGRPLTSEFARERIARMVCADANTFSDEDAKLAAAKVREDQVDRLRTAIARVCSAMPQRPKKWIISGSGEFLPRLATASPGELIVSLAAKLGPENSSSAAAYAVARLALENAKM